MKDAVNNTVALVPMTEAEYRSWEADGVPEYAAEKVKSGEWSAAEALSLAQQTLARLLPKGIETPDHHFFTIRGDGSVVLGTLWIALQRRADQCIALVYDIKISEQERRKGYASATFHALERKAPELGFTGISLHVFGHNPAAQALYTKLGFIATNINMFKSLTTQPPP